MAQVKFRRHPVLSGAVALAFAATVVAIPSVAIAAGTTWTWTGFAGVTTHSSPQNLTGVQNYRYDSIPSGVASGAGNCSTILGSQGDGTNQPFIYQDLVFAYLYQNTYNMYNFWGTIHQCQGYEWWLFLNEYNASNGVFYSNLWDHSISGSNPHHFYEFINTSGSSDVMAAQIDSTIEDTTPQNGVLGIAVASEVLSTSQNAVTTYQGSQLNYDPNFQGWQGFNMSSGDTYNNGATNSSGNTAMCSYVVSPPGSQVANFGENTSNMTNCT